MWYEFQNSLLVSFTEIEINLYRFALQQSSTVEMAFVLSFHEMLRVLATDEELKKSAKGILKQMAWTAGGTIAGGVFKGSQGAIIGGVAGCLIGYICSDEYKPVLRVLKNLRQHHRKKNKSNSSAADQDS